MGTELPHREGVLVIIVEKTTQLNSFGIAMLRLDITLKKEAISHEIASSFYCLCKSLIFSKRLLSR